MVGWHHRLNGDKFEQALGVGGGQGSLLCYSQWGLKESEMTEQLYQAELNLWQTSSQQCKAIFLQLKNKF